MAHAKLVSAFQFDTAFPRDTIICTLNFNHTGAGADWDDICNDLATIWDTHWFTTSGPPIKVRAYDNQGTPPVYPMGEGGVNLGGTPPVSNAPREVALCLSYYSERNIKSRRGRVYLPCNPLTSLAARPSGTLQNQALALAGHFAGLGGLDVDWEVWSPTLNAGMQVSNAWVDDEWDTQRRRGLKPTTRVTSAPGP